MASRRGADLDGALGEAFGPSSLLSATSVGEKGNRFSVRVGPDDVVAGVRLVPPTDPTGRTLSACDAAFLVATQTSPTPLVVLVELKGSHVDHAVDQIEASFERLCKRRGGSQHPGRASVREALVGARTSRARAHARVCLGVIVSRRGALSLRQVRRARLQKQGLVIRKVKDGAGLRVADLCHWAGGP